MITVRPLTKLTMDTTEVYQITRMGHPILARPAQPVLDPTAPDVARIVTNMLATLEALGGGLGLAAPQVSIDLRIVIFCLPAERSGQDEAIPLTVLINPMIEYKDPAMTLGWEACFSLPNMIGEVPRHQAIRYRYQTLTGEAQTCEAKGYHARIIQHELDHLDGILYPQRMADLSRFGYREEMLKYVIQPIMD
jgi:peptide deformylase